MSKIQVQQLFGTTIEKYSYCTKTPLIFTTPLTSQLGTKPHLNVYALATGAASPGYTFVPRAGSPEYTPVIGLIALIT